MKHKLIVIGVFLSTVFSFLVGQNAYEEGWKAFQKNDRTEARGYFNQANSNPESLLALSLVYWNENKLDTAFNYFRKFYETSSNPYPYLYALSSSPIVFHSSEVLSTDRLAFFEKIVTDPKMNGTLKAMLYEQIGDYYDRLNNSKKADENYAKVGALEKWQVLGTFDNISGSGFNKDWGVIEKSKPTDIFKNKVNADVNWYYPGANKKNKWLYFDYYFYMNNAVMYAQTFVNSPENQDVYLRAGTSGSLKIWVNDALISSVSEERNCDLDIYAYKTKLNKGNNRILIQIGISDIDRANFMVRLTDENGNPLNNITNSEVYADYTKSSEKYDLKELPFFAEDFFNEKIKTDPKNPLNYILLAETYLRNDKSYEGTKTLKTLENVMGKSTLSSYRLYEAFNRSQNQTDSEKELEYIKNTDPNSFYALQAKYDDEIKSEKYPEAEEILNKTKQLYGESSETDGWEINLASLQKRFDDLISLSKKMYKKYPDSYSYMYLTNMIEKNVSKNPKGAISIIENYLKKNTSSEALQLLSQSYLEQGNTEKGLAALYKRSAEKPYASGYYQNLISVLFGMQRYNEALSVSEKALTLMPFLPDVYTNKGYIYKNLNQIDNAKDNFKKAVYYSPTTYDARTQLRLLEKSKDVFSLFAETKLPDLISQAPTEKEYPNDNSIVLLNEQQQVVYAEGAKEMRVNLAAKILNKSGIEDWKEYYISYNSYWQKLIIDKAEVIKSNGTVSKAESDDNHIVFTNLEVNDVLHLEYRMQDLSTGKLASQFYDHFLFQYGVPIMINKYSLLVPDDKKFDYMVKNTDIKPEVTTIENMKLYKWELDNQPSINRELYMSPLADIAPSLTYSSIPDWKFVSDWYKDLTLSKFNPDYVLKQTYNDLIKGKENWSKLDKAKLFYNYILENITYSSVDFMQSNFVPQKASRTITTRLGDCKDLSTLFVALCSLADIDANLVLILTRDNGAHNLVLPTINFNHCIAQLNIDNKKYYLELTDNGLSFGSCSDYDLNSQILPIPFSKGDFGDKLLSLQMPDRIPNKSVREHTVKFNKNDMNIERNIKYYGSVASAMRGTYKSLNEEERLKKVNEDVAKEFTVSSKVSNLKFSDLDSLTNMVSKNYSIQLKGALQDVAGMKIFTLPWSDQNSLDVVALESRKYPLEYWYYQNEDNTIETITLNLPDGKKFVEIPENKKLECANASYSLNFDMKQPGKVIITRYFERKKDVVAVDEFEKFKEFLNSVSESDNKQFAIK